MLFNKWAGRNLATNQEMCASSLENLEWVAQCFNEAYFIVMMQWKIQDHGAVVARSSRFGYKIVFFVYLIVFVFSTLFAHGHKNNQCPCI